MILACCLALTLCSATHTLAADLPEPGDFDQDGKLDADDIDQLSSLVRAGTYDQSFDLNEDQTLDPEDRRIWVEELAWTYYGDANLNGVFNTGDLVHVFKEGEYEDTEVGNSTWETGDWNGDGDFGSGDLVLSFQTGAFEGQPRLPKHPGANNSVPEPSAWLLLAWAGWATCGLGRRRSPAMP
jgi:hypothetical protein